MPSKLYGSVVAKAFNKEIDLDSDTIKVSLHTSALSPNQDTQDYFDDVAGTEVTGSGYTSGGLTLGGGAASYDAATNTFSFDANDAVWPAATVTARYAVVYDATPASNAAKPLIGYVDFGSDKSSTNGNFTVTWDATGIIKFTVE